MSLPSHSDEVSTLDVLRRWTIKNVDGGPLVVRPDTAAAIEALAQVGASIEVVPAPQGAVSAERWWRVTPIHGSPVWIDHEPDDMLNAAWEDAEVAGPYVLESPPARGAVEPSEVALLRSTIKRLSALADRLDEAGRAYSAELIREALVAESPPTRGAV